MLQSDQVKEIIRHCGSRFSDLRQRLPMQLQITIGCFLVVLLCVGMYTVLTVRDSTLDFRVQHSFRSAQIAVLVDGDTVYSGKLTGSVRKKYGLFGDTLQGFLSHEIPISSGSHRLSVQITSDGTMQQESLMGDFPKNGERTLLVNARRGDVALSWQGGGSEISTASASGGSWLSRYATTLAMTIAGSIISALTGFALRELPGYLKSRQTSQ